MQAPLVPLEISVTYRLAEYLRLIVEFEPNSATHREAMQRAKASRWAKVLPSVKWIERAAIAMIGTPVFLYKRAVVGTCLFRVDHENVERRSKAGTVAEPWSSVVLVHRLTGAYIVELERGAMPLPYRCFSPEQRSAFERLVPGGKFGSPVHAV